MKKFSFLIILIFAIGGIFYTYSYIQDNNQAKVVKVPTSSKEKKKNIDLLALGDSLTQGVGDSTNKGGYVPLLSKKVEHAQNIRVKAFNYGVSGETSTQIDKRVMHNKVLQKNLAKSDVITMTVGGNDLMHIIMKKGLKLSKSDVEKGNDHFEDNLMLLIKDVRSYNNHAPIYIMGIYNPLSVYLKQVKYMNVAVKKWNNKSQKTASENYNTYFVNIDKIMSNPKVENKQNPLLYKKDHFHPNNKGYKLITDELYKRMNSNNDRWLYVK